ncbi:MAG TPA: hypothetical protein VG165_17735 [Solirubrobacteraceae bacterium]|jgi:hypothetical protein|nr:hypothetical protein [Solirubrobacteraceae bacterium]
MSEIFKGFLLLRLIGLLALLVVVGVVLGIRSLARGADVAGIALLAGALAIAVVIRSLAARRAGRSPRPRQHPRPR